MTETFAMTLKIEVRVVPIIDMSMMERPMGVAPPPGIAIFDLSGTITLADGSMALREAIRHALDTDIRHVVLNVAGVRHIDSTGVAEIISAWAATKDRDGELKLLSPQKQVSQVLEAIHMENVIAIYDNEQDILLSFAKMH